MNLVGMVDTGVVRDFLGSKKAIRMWIWGLPMGAPFRFRSPKRKRFCPTRTSLDAMTGMTFAPGESVGRAMTCPPGLTLEGDEDPHATATTASTSAAERTHDFMA